MILQILGIIFLLVICVVAYYGWKIHRFTKKQVNSDISIAYSVLPSQTMELEPSNAEEWKEKERLAYTESQLKKVGANHVGYFCVYNGYAIIRVSMWSYKDQAVAVIYEASSELDQNNVTFLYEVASKLENGSICITSNSSAVYDSRPSNHLIIFNESESILDFLRSIKSELPADEKLRKISDPKEFFIECYEDTSEWSWQNEQLSSDKTQQVLSSVGVNITEELMDELIDSGNAYSVEVNINKARRQLAKHSKMSVDQWENIRDRLVIINEKMQVYHLLDAIYDIAGDLTENQELVLEGFENNTDELIDPIAAFYMLVQSLNLKIKRVTKMDVPVKTEIFLPL